MANEINDRPNPGGETLNDRLRRAASMAREQQERQQPPRPVQEPQPHRPAPEPRPQQAQQPRPEQPRQQPSRRRMPQVEEYETVTVRREDYQEVYSDTGELEYTDIESVYINEEDAVLDSIKVKRDQRVRKGDVLAVYHLETSKTKLEKQKLVNQQARAQFESGLGSLKNSLSQAEQEYKSLSNAAEKKMKSLEIKKMQKEIEAYKKGEKELLEQEKEYARLVRMQSATKLVAKKGGVVTSVDRDLVGQDINSSQKIVEFRNNDKWLIKVSDPESMLRYNMKVKVRLGKNMKNCQHEVTATLPMPAVQIRMRTIPFILM